MQFLEDTRRGLFSYEALRSRLADSRFVEEGHTIMSAPVIRLRRLSDNELLALLTRLSSLYADLYGTAAVDADGCERFLRAMLARAGADELLTPRELIRDFLSLLDVLRENQGATLDALIASSMPKPADPQDGGDAQGETPAGGFFFNLSL